MRIRVQHFREMKKSGKRITAVTAYDYSMARLVDKVGIPMILVGDSLGNTVLGYRSTVRVTMPDMLHHTKAVVRGTKHSMVVADLPFLSYQVSVEDALRNAGQMVQEGGAHAVKLEGGTRSAETVTRTVEAGIPVVGHIGLTLQSEHAFGGFTEGLFRRLDVPIWFHGGNGPDLIRRYDAQRGEWPYGTIERLYGHFRLSEASSEWDDPFTSDEDEFELSP